MKHNLKDVLFLNLAIFILMLKLQQRCFYGYQESYHHRNNYWSETVGLFSVLLQEELSWNLCRYDVVKIYTKTQWFGSKV